MEAGPHSVPKGPTVQAHIFLWLPVSATVSCLAHCLERWRECWNRTACQRNTAPSTGQAQYKICSLFQQVPPLQVKLHLYIWVHRFSSLPNLLVLCVLLWSSGILGLQIFVEVVTLFWNLHVSGFICPAVSSANTDAVSYFRRWKWAPDPQRWANSLLMKIFLQT